MILMTRLLFLVIKERYNMARNLKEREKENIKKVEDSNYMSQPYLKFKVDADLALSVIYSFINILKTRIFFRAIIWKPLILWLTN